MGVQIGTLPTEVLRHIIKFLDVRSIVNICLPLDKRWHLASIDDLKTRTRLDLIYKWEIDKGITESKDYYNICNDRFREQMCERLITLFPGIKYLTLHSISYDWRDFQDMVSSLAPTLIELNAARFVFPTYQSIVYGSLTKVMVYSLIENNITKFPRISTIICKKFNSSVIPTSVQYLSVGILRYLKPYTDAILKLDNLKILIITLKSCQETEGILELLRALKNIVVFELRIQRLPSISSTEIDDAIRVLVAHNPRLEKIKLDGIQVTDVSLNHIARLCHLKSLESDGLYITSNGVVSLFQGPSSNILQNVRICKAINITRAHRHEIESIITDKPRTFRYSVGFMMDTVI